MGRTADLFFFLGMGALFTHELDAVTHHEWRLLPLLNQFPEALGKDLFVLLHVPLFALLIGLVASLRPRVRLCARLWIGGLTVVHAVAHTLLSGQLEHTFAGWLSHILIYGAAVFAFMALCLDFRSLSAQEYTDASAL